MVFILFKASSLPAVKCHRTTPTETETFSECLVPNCGISRVKSDASTTS